MGGPNHPKLDCLVFDHWNPCFWGIPHFRKPPYLQNTIKHRYTKCPKTNIERSSIKPNQKDRQGQRFFATRNHFFLEGKAEKKGRTTKKIHLIKKGTPDPGKKKTEKKNGKKNMYINESKGIVDVQLFLRRRGSQYLHAFSRRRGSQSPVRGS